MSQSVCESPVCGSPGNPASGDTRLCQGCLAGLAKDLAQLPALFARCESDLVNRPKRAVQRVSGGEIGGIELREEFVTARANMVSVLASWAGLVVEERRLSRVPARRVPEMVAFLALHQDWLATHYCAGDAAGEIREIVAEARAAIHPQPAARSVGACDRPGCEGTVRMTVRADGTPASDGVGCDAGHRWLPHEWLTLSHRLDQARRVAEENRAEDDGRAA